MSDNKRRNVSLNGDWKFLKDDPADAYSAEFDDSNWRTVQVPHDWSVEESFDEKFEGATGYLPGGIGWYRKTFESPNADVTYLHFDGIYNNVTVYLNGEKLGDHPYGYSPFYYNVSDKVVEGENVLAVRVDHSRYCDSRWYTGSGIYRNVGLVGASKTHIPVWGTFVTTPEIKAENAAVQLQATVCNPDNDVILTTSIFDPSGKKVAEGSAVAGHEVIQKLNVAKPMLWDIDSPNFYRAVTTLSRDGKTIDEYTTIFGIRTIRFDADEGFFLNGKHTLIKGVCLHHDGGCVGSAVPKDVWRRRFEKLKSAGVNAIRIAHNPGSTEFLDLCDEMGFLVQDEFFDEWDNPKDKRLNMNEQSVDEITRGYVEHFQAWAERDLKETVRSHRNHPSIIQWSIGNEIEWTYPRNADATGFFDAKWDGNFFWEQPPHSKEEIARLLKELPQGDYDIGETAQKLARWTKEMDATRPIVANCILPSASYLSGFVDALEVIGYSYRRVMYDYGHEHDPKQPIMGTENLAQWHEWKAIIERPFVAGTFLWTGIDYLGESNDQWPQRSTASGLLDTAGFEKGSYHMMKTLWNDEPHVHLATQTLEKSPYILNEEGLPVEEDPDAWQQKLWVWHDVNNHWNYNKGEMIAVEVYSNCEQVELLLNGESLGKKQLSDFEDRIYKWAVPFSSGMLEARGLTSTDLMVTASEPTAIKLEVDGCHVTAQLVDQSGIPVKTEEYEIIFTVSDGERILGLDNGSPCNTQDFQSDRIVTQQGRCLLVVDMNESITVEASAKGLVGSTVEVNMREK